MASFTLVELLAVIGIIVLLAGIIVGTASYANRKSLEVKTRSQLKQFELALELFKNDNGFYPVTPCNWPRTNSISHQFDSAGVDMAKAITNASFGTSNVWTFYTAVTGYSPTNAPPAPLQGQNYYPELKPEQIRRNNGTNYLVDPYGNIWGYFRTTNTVAGWHTNQFNPRSYDLWSFGMDPKDPTNSLISNWRQP